MFNLYMIPLYITLAVSLAETYCKIQFSYQNHLEEVAAQFIIYIEKVMNYYVKLFKQYCQINSMIDHDASPNIADFNRLLAALIQCFLGFLHFFTALLSY